MESNVSSTYRKALRNPLVIVLILAGILIAAFGGSLVWLLIGGLVLASAFVAADRIRKSPGFQKAIRTERDRMERAEVQRNLTFRIEELDADARVKVKSILKCHRDIGEEARSTGRDTVPEVANVLLQTNILLERAMSIAQKRRELLANLRNIDVTGARSKLEELKNTADSEQDPARMTELRTVIEARTSDLNNAEAIESTCARILSELDSIDSSFAVIRSNLMKLAGDDAESRIAAGRELSKMLERAGGDAELDGADSSDPSDLSDLSSH